MSRIKIRQASVEDAGLLLRLIIALAAYEKAESEVVATEEDIKNSLFGDAPTAQALICSIDSEPIGYAVYFFNYSTWLGRKGLYLEDLFILPEYRGLGAGTALMKYLAKIAVEKNCGRFEWSVLDWNEPAIQFYNSIGAKPQDGWIGYRLTGSALEALANKHNRQGSIL